ncbi:hypothetical protein GCM10025870_31440 [Agromyces marinus]|uniref:Uncharacterized protein n=1 Tax=Agromyces marinus TaxID=1389020 RepID=A0ABN6YJ71_9MICO|nr:hypothetical protein GCM10025870_31440 [Agromyces marinus]
MGIHPVAWVVSTSVSAPASRAAVRTDAASATSPVADCTSENATSHVVGRISSARLASGTWRTRRSPRARNGATTELKSPSTHSTSAPAGADAAASPVNTETCEPSAMRSVVVPSRVAAWARERSTMPEYSAAEARPALQRSRSERRASTVAVAGRPMVHAAR